MAETPVLQNNQDLSEDARKFIEEGKQKIAAGKKRCPVCRQKTPHEKVALVEAKIGLTRSPLAPGHVTPKLLLSAAVLPFEQCTKCGNVQLTPKFFERQVRQVHEEFERKKRAIELGIDPRKLPLTSKPEDTAPLQSGPEKRIPSGLIVPGKS